MGRALLGGQVERVEADVMPADVERHGGLTRREATDARNPQLNDESPIRCKMARGVAEAGDLLGLGTQVSMLFQTTYTSENGPETVPVAMSPTMTGMSVRFLLSWSTIGCESSMPATDTPRSTRGMATRPVPIANSSARPSPASAASRSTVGPSTSGANMPVPGVS